MSFGRDLRRYAEKTEQNLGTVYRSVTIKLFSQVVQLSPVDTGRFRGNWQTTTGAPADQAIARADPSGALAQAEVAQNVGPLGSTSYLTNNLPYAQRLEYGYSGQAPGGMVRISVARFKALVKEAAR